MCKKAGEQRVAGFLNEKTIAPQSDTARWFKTSFNKRLFLVFTFFKLFHRHNSANCRFVIFFAFTSGVDDSGAKALIFSSTASAKFLTYFADQRPLLAVERINAAKACKTGLCWFALMTSLSLRMKVRVVESSSLDHALISWLNITLLLCMISKTSMVSRSGSCTFSGRRSQAVDSIKRESKSKSDWVCGEEESMAFSSNSRSFPTSANAFSISAS